MHRAEQVAAEAEDRELSLRAVREAGDIIRAAHQDLDG
jgi:hypothetical protein